jgi:hypothetical protein
MSDLQPCLTIGEERGPSTRDRLRQMANRWRVLIGSRRARRAVVFYTEGCGLANRLRALVGYQALANILKVPFYLYWVSDAACPCRFEDLFETPLSLLNSSGLRRFDQDTVFRDPIWFSDIWKQRAADFAWREYLREVHRCLQGLVPRRELLEPVRGFAAKHDLGKALGVHIRHTDNLGDYAQWAAKFSWFDITKISSIDGFIDVIRTAIRTRPVMLATDDAALEGRLKTLFPSLISFPKSYALAGLRTTPIEIALSEMLLLGQCQQIVGTYCSSFSEFSAVWSGAAYSQVIGRECVRCDWVNHLRLTPD